MARTRGVGVYTTLTQISVVHPNYSASSLMGPYCVHAYHHYCINRVYTTGFGPLEEAPTANPY